MNLHVDYPPSTWLMPVGLASLLACAMYSIDLDAHHRHWQCISWLLSFAPILAHVHVTLSHYSYSSEFHKHYSHQPMVCVRALPTHTLTGRLETCSLLLPLNNFTLAVVIIIDNLWSFIMISLSNRIRHQRHLKSQHSIVVEVPFPPPPVLPKSKRHPVIKPKTSVPILGNSSSVNKPTISQSHASALHQEVVLPGRVSRELHQGNRKNL
jgi:hypothetical protein